MGESRRTDYLPHRLSQLLEAKRASPGLARAHRLEQERMLPKRPALANPEPGLVELRGNTDVFSLEAEEPTSVVPLPEGPRPQSAVELPTASPPPPAAWRKDACTVSAGTALAGKQHRGIVARNASQPPQRTPAFAQKGCELTRGRVYWRSAATAVERAASDVRPRRRPGATSYQLLLLHPLGAEDRSGCSKGAPTCRAQTRKSARMNPPASSPDGKLARPGRRRRGPRRRSATRSPR